MPTPATRSPRRWPPRASRSNIVVNNAGFGLFGQAIELDRAEQLGIIDVNIRALTDLSLRFSDSLIRHRGGILNIGFDRRLSAGTGHGGLLCLQGLCAVVQRSAAPGTWRPAGVRVTALCPGPVPSEFQARAGFEPGFDSAVLNVQPSAVALAGYRGLMASKRAVLPGVRHQARPVPAAVVSAGIYPGGGRPASAANRLLKSQADLACPEPDFWPAICLKLFLD